MNMRKFICLLTFYLVATCLFAQNPVYLTYQEDDVIFEAYYLDTLENREYIKYIGLAQNVVQLGSYCVFIFSLDQREAEMERILTSLDHVLVYYFGPYQILYNGKVYVLEGPGIRRSHLVLDQLLIIFINHLLPVKET